LILLWAEMILYYTAYQCTNIPLYLNREGVCWQSANTWSTRSHNMNAKPNSTKNSPHKGHFNDVGHSDHSNQTNNWIIIEINVEWLTRAKSEYLQRLAVDQSATVIFLQKTHIPANGNIINYQIPGFRLAC